MENSINLIIFLLKVESAVKSMAKNTFSINKAIIIMECNTMKKFTIVYLTFNHRFIIMNKLYMYKYNNICSKSDTIIFQFLLLRIVLKQNLPSEATKAEAAAK